MHDGTVCVDRPLGDFIVLLEFDYYYLRFLFFIKLLADANEVI